MSSGIKTGNGFSGQRGQTIVEFAIVLPIFLALVFSVLEIGRAWSTKQALTIAAREGSRILVLPYGAGLTYNSESAVQTAALNTATGYLGSSGVVVDDKVQISLVRMNPGNDGAYGTADDPAPEVGYSNAKRGDRVGIRITHTFETPLPIILGMFNNLNSQNSIAMGVTCFMEHE
ncbi:MAG: pilus assembly protein [Acidobacteria bacterium]|nr:pilus assembly protein [Acidobacteriota bacterium]MBK9706046.1 pilus assembly protein [Acidobacteriota bacterium]